MMGKDKQEVRDNDHDEKPYNEEVEKKMKRSCADDDDEKVKAQNLAPTLTKKCNLCGKTFSNGKALGGHRRSHFQAAKGNNNHSSQQKVKTRFSNLSKTTSNNNKAICNDDDDNDGKKQLHTCCLCEKDFPSKNALFGHMRSHPGREWRGLYPPNTTPPSCSLSSDNSMELYKEDHDDDFVGKDVIAPNEPPSLPRWQKKDKRGRKSIGAYEAAENLFHFRMEYYYANNNMVKPKTSTTPPEAPIPCNEKDIAEAEPSSSEKHALKKIKFYVSGSLMMGNKNNDDGDKMNNRTKGKEVKEDADWAKDDVGFFDERKKNKGKKKIKKLLVKPKIHDSELEDKGFLDKSQKKVNGYECDICCKSFPTFQALGGHKSIHNKEKSIMAEPKPSNAIAEVVMEEAANNIGTETLVGTAPLNSTEEASSSQYVSPKILDFDLNEPLDDMHE